MSETTPGHRRPWSTIIFAVLAVVTFLMVTGGAPLSLVGGGYGGSVSNVVPPMAVSIPAMPPSGIRDVAIETSASYGGSAKGIAIAPDYYPQPHYYDPGTTPVNDLREFNKVSYSASMRTRHVQDLVRRAETTIRGFGGRVDQTSSADKYGYITFVVPQSKFDEFRAQIESFVSPKFLTIDISSQNLLPQKQNIEQTQAQVEKNIADLTASRKKIVSAHSSAVSSLQSQIDADTREQASLKAEVTNDQARQVQIANRQYELSNELVNLRSRLASENASYSNNIATIDAELQYNNDNLTGVKQQDQDLLDNVATVNGTISFQWISLWEVAHTYLPGYWIPAIFALLSLISYYFERKRMIR